MEGQVRFFLPEGGVSALDAPGRPFHDPAARAALYTALYGAPGKTPGDGIVSRGGTVGMP